jgi:uncharacterized protein (TIGR03083 family)
MDKDFYLECLKDDAAAMVTATSDADLNAPVPSCPGWSIADLVSHTAEVHYSWTENVSRGIVDLDGLKARPPFQPAPRDQLVEQLRSGAERLIATLSAADPDDAVWNWSSTQPKTVAFVPRRMAHETSVHRWDAQSAIGRPEPIHSELAADGIDEFFYVQLPEEDAPPPDPGTVHFHRTDGRGEWFVTMAADGVTVRDEHAKGDAAARAPSSDLVLMLWRRVSPSDVEVLGDGAVLDRFIHWVDLS